VTGRRAAGGRALVLRRVALVAVLATLLAATPDRGHAHEPSASVWTYSFYKTLTYEFFANGSDLILYSTLGGTAASSVPFMAVDVLSAASAYYIHELAWNIFGPTPETSAGSIELGLTKTLTYRVVSTSRNLVLAYAFTGSPWTAVGYRRSTMSPTR
jgi:uncharacterized membrane protein